MSIVFRGILAVLSLLSAYAVFLVGQDVFLDAQGTRSETKASADWLREEPLSTRPVRSKLIELIESEAFDEAKPLADNLFARNKREVMARLVMAQEKLDQEGPEAFVEAFIPIFRLDRDNQSSFAVLLAEQSRDLDVLNAVRPHLEDAPKWGRAYLKAISDGDIQPPERLAKFYKPYPSEHRGYFEALIRKGQLDLAYLAFFDYLDDKTYLSIPYDPEFLGYPGAAPFNWAYNAKYTSRRPSGAAEVSLFGGERPVLLSQAFPLSAGTYEVVSDMYGEASKARGYFAWQVQCINQSRPLVEHRIEELSTRIQTERFIVDVPRNCPYQVLKLVGVPGSFPRTVVAEISRVNITRIEAVQEPTE